jgi:hypothetical protein
VIEGDVMDWCADFARETGKNFVEFKKDSVSEMKQK